MSRRTSLWSRTFRPRLDRLEGREVPAVFTVTTASDDPADPGTTLREALTAANTATGADEIQFALPAGSTITIDPTAGAGVPQGPLPTVTEALTITGLGSAALTVSGNKLVRVFDATALLTITGLTIANGRATDSNGGGIRAKADLTLTDVILRGNAAAATSGVANGGGVSASGRVTAGGVQFLNNTATGDGGGLAFADDAPLGGGLTAVAVGPVVFRGNTAAGGIGGPGGRGDGGGLYLAAQGLDGAGLVFDTNTAARFGGGLAAGTGGFGAGTFTLRDATLTGNAAQAGGGAAVFDAGGTLSGSTFANNKATGANGTGSGGGLYLAQTQPGGGVLTVRNSTFVGNSAETGGGLVAQPQTGQAAPILTLESVTVTRNTATSFGGAGLRNTAGGQSAVSLLNSILAGNTSSGGSKDDVFGAISSLGTNLYGTFSGPAPGFGATDIQTADARLDVLATNGGPTQTIAPLAGSPALGAGNPTAATVTTDQRGRPRPTVVGQFDIGAFQAQRPTAAADTFTLPPGGGPVAAPGVLANDKLNDVYTPLTAVLVTPPPTAAGTLTFNPDGSFQFAATAGFFGPATFTYRATDGVTSSGPVVVTLTILPTPPTANPDAFTTPFATPLTVPAPGVLTNDTKGSGPGPLTATGFTPLTPAAAGTLTPAATGGFVFTPAAGFSGQATFTYTANDGVSDSLPTTVTLTVLAPPVANPDSYSTAFGTPLTVSAAGVLANDTVGGGPGPLTVAGFGAVNPAAAGTVTPQGTTGGFTFTPAPLFSGVATFTYTAFDGASTSLPGTVTLTVRPPTPPTARPDAVTIPFGQPLTIPDTDLLANDTKGSGPGPLVISGFTSLVPAAAGTLVPVLLNQGVIGGFTFTPAVGFSGPATFTYTANDGASDSQPATVTLTVLAPPSIAGPADQSLPAGGTTGPLPVTLSGGVPPYVLTVSSSDVSIASAVVAGTGASRTVTVSANPDFAAGGSALITLVVRDAVGRPGQFQFRVSIAAGVRPTANPDQYNVTPDTPLTVPAPGVLANDTPGPTGGRLTAIPYVVNANLTLNRDGSFTYIPEPGFTGTVTFTYRAFDGVLLSTPATVTLNVGAFAPVAPDRSYGPVQAGATLTVPAAQGLLAGVHSPNGRPLRVINVVPAVGAGTVNVAADGGFTVTPPADAPTGSSTFTYQLTDDFGPPSAPATVTVRVTAAPPPPAVTRVTAFATGAGVRAVVRVVRPDLPDLTLTPFEDSFRGGVRVAVADLNRDGFDDVAVGAGPSGGPRVMVFDGRTGAQIANFFAFERTFRGGVHVGAADSVRPDGTRTSLLVLGAGSFLDQPGTPRVRAFPDLQGVPAELDSVSQGTAAVDFIDYDPRFQGGVRVAAGDLDGDGSIELVTIAGPSGGPDLRVYDTARLTDTTPLRRQQLNGLGAGAEGYRGGAFVAVSNGSILVTPDSVTDPADTDLVVQGDRLPNTGGGVVPGITAATVQRPPAVSVFRPTTAGSGLVSDTPATLDLTDPGQPVFLGGVRVTAGQLVLVGYGPGGAGRVRRFAFNPAGGLDPSTDGSFFPLGALGDASVYVGLAPLPYRRPSV